MADLVTRRVEQTLVVTLNRPEKRNALSLEMLAELEKTLEAAAEDGDLRALVLTGAGEKSFSAGMDLGVLFEHLSSNPGGERIRKVQRRLQELMRVARQFVAFRRLLAYRQQPDPRCLDPERHARVHAAHHGELQEVLRPALHARAISESCCS